MSLLALSLSVALAADPPAHIFDGKLGRLSKAQIRQMVQSNAQDIAACYEEEKSRHAGVRPGTLVISFTVAESGDVSDATIKKSGLGDAAVDKCVLDLLSRWVFPLHGGGPQPVTYPFVFRPH